MFKTLLYLISLGVTAAIIVAGLAVAMCIAIICAMLLKPVFKYMEKGINQLSKPVKFNQYGY